jgi:crotonobetainyl-CoA:carnitine CoA-transferase CaiB-like acyl-CoA transferase
VLADLGADVIKVENPDGGDDTRKWGPPFVTGARRRKPVGRLLPLGNRGKRSIAIDFTTPEGAETLRS